MVAFARPGSAQVVVGEFQSEQPSFIERFGGVLDLGGDVLAVGTWRRAGIDLYVRGSEGWTLHQQLFEPAAANLGPQFHFGASVAVDGDWIAVGVPGHKVGGQAESGAVYLYRRVGETWDLQQTLVASVPVWYAHFGTDLAMEDGILAITAPDETPLPSLSPRGAVYVFERAGESWEESDRLDWDNTYGSFGASVCVDRGRILVGATVDSQAVQSGRAMLFERSPSGWVKSATVFPNEAWVDLFGASVVLDDDRMAVSAWGGQPSNVPRGVYVFAKQANGWKFVQKILPLDPLPTPLTLYTLDFGRRLSLEGDDLLVSSHAFTWELGGQAGSVYQYRKHLGATETWDPVGKLVPPDASSYDWSGAALVRQGSRVLLGTPGYHSAIPGDWYASEGRVVEFELGLDAEQYCHCSAQAPCDNPDAYGGCTNSERLGAGLWAGGSGSVADDNLRLDAHWAVPLKSIVLLMGPQPQATPFGDGRLCVGPGATGLLRFPLQVTDTKGSASWGPGLVATTHAIFPPWGQIQPGDTWYFQAWYRDLEGPCGSGVNLTNAVKVDFKP